MTKKKVIRNFGRENRNFFGKKSSFHKFWSAKIFPVPPNSAPGLRRCVHTEGRGVRRRWTDADGDRVQALCGRPHRKYLNQSLTSSCLLLMQRSWRFSDQDFVFGRNEKRKCFFSNIYNIYIYIFSIFFFFHFLSQQKFLMTFFIVIDQIFQIFPFFSLYLVC